MLELLSLLATCSPPPPGFYDVRPPSGSILPSNAQLVLLSYYQGTPQISITQEDAIYQVTPIIENGIVRVDVGALGIRGEMTLFATATEPGSMSVTASFTVVDQADTAPPVFSGIDQITYEYMESEPGLCWPGGFGVRAHFPPARDDWAATYYELYETLPNDALRWAGSTFHSDAPSLAIITFPGEEEGTRCYIAFAHDVAGNVDPEAERGGFCVDLVRNQLDAGVIDSSFEDATTLDTGTLDGGVRDSGTKDSGVLFDSGTGGELVLDGNEGCGCSVSSTVMSTEQSHGILLLLAGLALLRRKR